MKKLFFLLIQLNISYALMAQSNGNRIPMSSLEYLYITPDAQSGSMGFLGVSTLPNEHSSCYNAASMAFVERYDFVGSVSFTPWNSNLVSDMGLYHVNILFAPFKNKRENESIKNGSRLGFSASMFSYGQAELRDNNGTKTGTISSNDWNIRANYATKLSSQWAMGVALRLTQSNLFGGTQQGQAYLLQPITSLNADLGAYHQDNRNKNKQWYKDFGVSIHNIGSRISDGGLFQNNFQPTLFRMGTTFSHIFEKDKLNSPIDETPSRLSISLEATKQLVPTPPKYGTNGEIVAGNDPKKTTGLGAIFSSWGDAPDGIGEELKEIWWGLGAEYLHKDHFALRAGYFYDAPSKGNRQLLTMGFGVKNIAFGEKEEKNWLMGIDASYRLSLGGYNPLGNSFQFTLSIAKKANNPYIPIFSSNPSPTLPQNLPLIYSSPKTKSTEEKGVVPKAFKETQVVLISDAEKAHLQQTFEKSNQAIDSTGFMAAKLQFEAKLKSKLDSAKNLKAERKRQ